MSSATVTISLEEFQITIDKAKAFDKMVNDKENYLYIYTDYENGGLYIPTNDKLAIVLAKVIEDLKKDNEKLRGIKR